jgi:hypothetical protein
MRLIKLSFATITILFAGVSCTSHKMAISQNAPNFQATTETAIVSQSSSTSMIEAAPKEVAPTLYASTTEIVTLEETANEVKSEIRTEKIKAALEKIKADKSDLKTLASTHKSNFVEKLIVKKLEKRMAKKATQPVDYRSWNTFLKAGLILLGIGIILAIFGLGGVGGVSAFIGLLFVIIGLLAEV